MKIIPGSLEGAVHAPASKSHTHRALICAALAKGSSQIKGALVSDDTLATARGLSVLGAKLDKDHVDGTYTLEKGGTLQCQESGSTLRFLLPVACLSKQSCTLVGTGQLPHRPVKPLANALNALGADVQTQNGGLPALTQPGLKGGRCTLPGHLSSQFVSGLLFALPLCKNDSTLNITGPLQSKPYADLTKQTIQAFGVDVKEEDGKYHVPGNQQYQPQKIQVEGDWSSAAFWMVAGAVGGDVHVTGLESKSLQGDKAVAAILEKMGADVQETANGVRVTQSPLQGVEVDVSNIPDLLPILSVAACFAQGTTRFYNAERLRLKESDRLGGMAEELSAMGVTLQEKQDELVIRGGKALKGTTLKSHGDHRIAMSLVIAALHAKGESELDDADCVAKSYPGFFSDLSKLRRTT
ncbi:3-phosphoshikimate 1-carboxyvinyltransferase [Candidatus Micrarchaeota archaeon]|nr:3-phosphoshikimate 1-carboxyvinyltransferase [Candidatus Micrarchaeota archaeon]